jgi:hypothetical protein
VLEKIVNIYLIIEGEYISQFKGIAYEKDGSDFEKIEFLKSQAEKDLTRSINFPAPTSNKGDLMTYKQFNKLAKHGEEHKLFTEIFEYFELPENPLICVSPVVNGKINIKI